MSTMLDKTFLVLDQMSLSIGKAGRTGRESKRDRESCVENGRKCRVGMSRGSQDQAERLGKGRTGRIGKRKEDRFKKVRAKRTGKGRAGRAG